MPIDSTHPDYQTKSTFWTRCRDVISGGEDGVKAKKTLYLPQPIEMEDSTYTSYVERATFYNASKRTAGGYEGMILRKDPEVKVPDSVEPLLKDITLAAVPFSMFARQVVREIIDVGRCGVLVDVQEEGVPNRRPYLSMYAAEDILDWETESRGGDEVLTMVKLKELVIEKDPKDPWTRKTYEALRILTLGPVTEPDEKGVERNFTKDVYRVRYYVKREQTAVNESAKEAYNLELDVVPQFSNKDPLDFIPFQFFGASDVSPEIGEPPLIDLVNMNLSHYRTMADLEWARYYIAFPQVYVTGCATDVKLKRAANLVWKFSDPQSKVGVVGGDETDISALENAASKKEKLMSTLGARLLEEQKKEAEAAETLRLRQSGEQASLSTIASSAGFGLTQSLSWLSLWSGASEAEISVKMNSVFVDESADPQLVASLLEAVQAGKMSFATFYQNLVRFGIARDGITAEQELKDIDGETPAPEM